MMAPTFQPRPILAVAAIVICTLASAATTARAAQVLFDLPDTIECRNVTPAEFAAVHPGLKVIEAKLRISARVVEGSEAEIVDFLYILTSPDKSMRFQDYLPNTTLESKYVDDRIEVKQSTGDTKSGTLDAHVSYQVLQLGGSATAGSSKSESSQYQQIVPKSLVLASGTTDREHGLFFKLRPSRDASLEGAKEFTFLATVPKSWRGDWCTISCAARTNKRSWFWTNSVEPGGVEQAQVGLYLVGDGEAFSLARELRRVQEAHAEALAANLAHDGDGLLETMYDAASAHYSLSAYTARLCGIFRGARRTAGAAPTKSVDPLEAAEQAVVEVQHRLRRLAE